jgi:hypothetical protein
VKVLCLRLRIKDTEEALLSFLKKAIPFYEAIEGIRIRILRNTNDPSRFIEIVEYATDDAFESDQRRVAEDRQMKTLLAEWHALLADAVEVEIFEDLTSKI